MKISYAECSTPNTLFRVRALKRKGCMRGEFEKELSKEETRAILNEFFRTGREASVIARDFRAEMSKDNDSFELTLVFNDDQDTAYHLEFTADGESPNFFESEDLASPPSDDTVQSSSISEFPMSVNEVLKQLKGGELDTSLDVEQNLDFLQLRMDHLATQPATAKTLASYTSSRRQALDVAHAQHESSAEERAQSLRDTEELAPLLDAMATKRLIRSIEPDKQELDDECSVNWESACMALGVEVTKFATDKLRAGSWRFLTEDVLSEIGEISIERHSKVQIRGEDFLVVGLLATPDRMPLFLGETLPAKNISMLMIAKLEDIDLEA